MKKITFINGYSRWRVISYSLGLASIFFGLISLLLGVNQHFTLWQSLGVVFLMLPSLFPLQFNHFVRYQGQRISVKLNGRTVSHLHQGEIEVVEAFSDRLEIHLSGQKKRLLPISGYAHPDVERLIELLENR
ncbi:hypothetical protein [Croceiramulus getboli]|nr:hypothetical protein P8624_04935 [Flavobacteriaceae bacterium YJPT1-3]